MLHLFYALCMGIAYLSPQQFAEAEAIALQCPREGGSAVYAARALYRLNDDRAFAEDSLCLVTQERSIGAQLTLNSGLRLTPNPAADQVTVQGLILEAGQQAEVILFDLNGRVCLSALVSANDPVIPIGGLPGGVYFCRINTVNAPPVALKLLIAH